MIRITYNQGLDAPTTYFTRKTAHTKKLKQKILRVSREKNTKKVNQERRAALGKIHEMANNCMARCDQFLHSSK